MSSSVTGGQRATRGGVRHLVALGLHEVHDDGDRVVGHDAPGAEPVVQHTAAGSQRRDGVERLDRLVERRVAREPALHHGVFQTRHVLARALLHRLDDRAAERLAPFSPFAATAIATTLRIASCAWPARPHLARPSSATSAMPRTLLERTLAGEHRERIGHVQQALPVVVLGQFHGGRLQLLVAALFGELHRQLAQQRAAVIAAAGIAQAAWPSFCARSRSSGMIAHCARQRVQRAGSLPSPSCASTSSFAAACVCMSDSERSATAARGLPLLLGQHLLAQRQQRLLAPLDLAVQRADGREQVVDTPGSVRPA
jgi:hypothetical protein